MGTAAAANRVEKLNKNKNSEKATQTKFEIRKPADPNIFTRLVERKAYDLYEKRGCQNGHDWDDWFEAEKIVETEMISAK